MLLWRGRVEVMDDVPERTCEELLNEIKDFFWDLRLKYEFRLVE